MAEIINSSNHRGIDLFCGAGGMSIGAIMAGVDVVLAVEADESAAETYRLNHPSVKLIESNIKHVSPHDHTEPSPFVVFGGPPCQGFSTANTKTRTLANKNNFLFEEFIRFVDELNPHWFVFENVEGFQTFQKGQVVKTLRQRFESIGYHTSATVLSAADFGVPQNRKRFFMVGNRHGLSFVFPQPSAVKVSVKDALYDLPALCNGSTAEELPYKSNELNDYLRIVRNTSAFSRQNYVSCNQEYVLERYRHIKPGQNWQAIPEILMNNYAALENCHSGIYKRLNPDEPSVVISNYRKNMLIHPWEDRGLSVREAARLQSFPDDFTFYGKLSHQQQQIGNAVPPLLAKAIFSQIIKYSYAQVNNTSQAPATMEV